MVNAVPQAGQLADTRASVAGVDLLMNRHEMKDVRVAYGVLSQDCRHFRLLHLLYEYQRTTHANRTVVGQKLSAAKARPALTGAVKSLSLQ